MPAGGRLFGGSLRVDAFARFLKLLALIGSAGALLMSLDYLQREAAERSNIRVLFLLATLGMMMMVSAGDLIALYLGLELQSPVALRGRRLSTATTRARPRRA